MGDGPSDWEKGVLAAARWLRDETAKQLGDLPDSEAFRTLGDNLAQEMLRSLTPDPEGTEARVMQQIARFVREGTFLRDWPKEKMLKILADAIERYDWRKS